MKLLIDADIIAYQAASAAEEVTCWGNDKWTLHSDMAKAKLRFDDSLHRIVEGTREKDPEIILVYSDFNSGNWRKDEWPDYKANRKGKRKPIVYHDLVEWSCAEWKYEEALNLEADDLMGILATRHPEDTIICSIDKDMRTIPCTLYNWDKDNEPKEIGEEEALLWLATQALMGDATDGYKGLPGCGPVSAKKVLADLDGTDAVEVWMAVWAAYKKKGFEVEDMVQQARLARICREGDWDFVNCNMTWTPEV